MNRSVYDLIWEYVVSQTSIDKTDNAASRLYNAIIDNLIPVPETKDDVEEILECINSALKYGKGDR